ncbi:Wzy polymerase domain-containing protein [Vibrio sp.]|nr:Wzy polymerase domain-containing protein [Vibrio sp.]
MAQLLLKGTRLEEVAPKKPLSKLFISIIGSLYIVLFYLSAWWDSGYGIERYSNLLTWFVSLTLILVGLIQVTRNCYLRYSKLTLGLFFCCVLLTLPIFESDVNLTQSLPRVIAIWLGWLLFLSLQQFPFSNKYKQRLLWFIILSSLIQTTFSYAVILSVYLDKGLFEPHQIWGGFSSYYSLATFLMTGVLASGYLLAKQPRKYQFTWNKNSLLYFVPIYTLPLLLQMYSPTLWFTLLISISALLKYVIKRSTTRRLVGWSISLFFGTVFGTLYFYTSIISPVFPNSESEDSMMLSSIAQTSDMFIERPFSGYGYGKFPEEYVLYTARQHALNPSFPPAMDELLSPHSEILVWGIEGGLIPVVAIILAGLFVLARGYFAKKGVRLATFSLLFPVVIGSQCSDIIHQTHLHWITFVILLYWLDQRVTRYRRRPLPAWKIRSLQLTALPIGTVFCAYLILVGYNHYYYYQFKQAGTYSLLNKLIEPTVYRDRVLVEKITEALKENSSVEISHYLPELLTLIKQQPSPAYYDLLIRSYDILGDENKALQTHLEAHYLFPQHHFHTEIPSVEEVP